MSCGSSTLSDKGSGFDGATSDDSSTAATDATANAAPGDGGAADGGAPDGPAVEAGAGCLEADTAVPQLPGGKLQATFDARGLAHLSYDSVVLVDLDSSVGDAFGVGGYSLGGTSGSGSAGYKAQWDAPSHTLTWSYGWGSVSSAFAIPPGVDTLDITITVHNTSAQSLDAIAVNPLGLMFPVLPAGWGAANYPQFHDNLDAPDLLVADFGSGLFVLADGDAQPLYLGFSPSGAADHYALVAGTLGSTSEGFLSTAVPVTRAVGAGQSATYALSMRFAPEGTDYHLLETDVVTTFARAWPQTLVWNDRRPIGELFVTNPTNTPIASSSPNPRNYTFAPNIDITTAQGLSAFQMAALTYASNAVTVLKSMNAQGAIVWDLEGQQYPQPNTSYVGDPSLLPMMAPEMDGVADAFFKTFTSAGLACGMTIRPQKLDLTVSPPNQDDVPIGAEAALMIQKIQYANQRWGCTIFYVDSDGGPDDATAPSTFQAVAQAIPGILIIPENIWSKDSAYTAPLASFTAPYKPLHTPADQRLIWPNALTVTYVGDAPNNDLTNNPANANQWNEFVQAVKGGDILSFRAWFDDEPLNGQVKQIYQAAGAFTPAPTVCP